MMKASIVDSDRSLVNQLASARSFAENTPA
jgi:hypothetical protein